MPTALPHGVTVWTGAGAGSAGLVNRRTASPAGCGVVLGETVRHGTDAMHPLASPINRADMPPPGV